MEKLTRLLTAAMLCVACAVLAPATPAKDKDKQESFALIEGTVFQKSGFSLPGAQVTVTPVPEDGKQPSKKEVHRTTTDRRGEFSVRVPPGTMRYTVDIEAEGWQPARKSVEIFLDQRFIVSFRLQPSTAKGKEQ